MGEVVEVARDRLRPEQRAERAEARDPPGRGAARAIAPGERQGQPGGQDPEARGDDPARRLPQRRDRDERQVGDQRERADDLVGHAADRDRVERSGRQAGRQAAIRDVRGDRHGAVGAVTAVAQADRQRRRDVDRRHDQQPGEPGAVEPRRAGARCSGGRRDGSLGRRFGRAGRHDRIRAAAVLLGRGRGPQASIRSQDSGVPRSIARAARRPSTSS